SSTVVRRPAGLFTMRVFLAPVGVAGHSRRLYLYAPSRGKRLSARICQGYARHMARLVMKFGGTSVADIEHIRNVARHVKREVDAGHEVAVVVSAMSGPDDPLITW